MAEISPRIIWQTSCKQAVFLSLWINTWFSQESKDISDQHQSKISWLQMFGAFFMASLKKNLDINGATEVTNYQNSPIKKTIRWFICGCNCNFGSVLLTVSCRLKFLQEIRGRWCRVSTNLIHSVVDTLVKCSVYYSHCGVQVRLISQWNWKI